MSSERIKIKRFLLVLALPALVLVLLAIGAEKIYFSDFEYRYRTTVFNRILAEKETVLNDILEGMRPILAFDTHHHGSELENNLFSIAEKNKITILEFLDHKLFYWSDNSFDVPPSFDDSLYVKPLIFLQNGWFLTRVIEAGNEKVVGLLRITSEFSVQNDIIRSGFEEEFRLPGKVGFSTDFNASPFHVKNKSGEFLFSLIFPNSKEHTGFIFVPLLLWSAAFIILLVILLEGVRYLGSRGRGKAGTLLATAVCAGFYMLSINGSVPKIFKVTELFSPYRFSMNDFIPTLGHLVLLGILAVFVAGVFFRFYTLDDREEGRKGNFILLSLSLVSAAVIISLYHYLFNRLMLTSNISFQPFRILDLSIYSFAGFLSVFLLIIFPVLFLLKVFTAFRNEKNLVFAFSLLPSLLTLLILNHSDFETAIVLVLFCFLLFWSIWIAARRKPGMFAMTVVFSFIFGLYSLFFITVFCEEKTTENLKIQAVSFSTENDPQAEQLLLDMWPMVSGDLTLKEMMLSDSFSRNNENVATISSYLHDAYFSGYWSNFNLNVVLCRNDDPLHIGPGDEIYPSCFRFFDEKIRRDGHRLTGTGFYFIDNQGGRPYYLCKLEFPAEGNHINGLIIELYGDVNIFQPGYSALLLDEKYHGYSGLKNYSFAKYINGEIVLRTGEFAYDKTDAGYIKDISDYRIFMTGGFRHVLYKNGNATVIISRPVITPGNLIISFAYLFSFILLFSNILVLALRRTKVKVGNLFNFRQKLQLSYIGILLFSFLMIGIVVAYLTITQYKSKHYENIREKLASVSLELGNRISMENHLDPDWRSSGYNSLNDLLINLSNVFNTDINLYSITGELIATSRPEIYYRNLTGRRINNMAWTYLTHFTRSEYYQREKIGSLEYISAYAPFYNSGDHLLAYLNLPYFRMQSVLAQEISNLVVAIVNFTLLLILITMGLAVVISGRLTAPLSMLGEGLASVGVGRKTKHLSYKGNDEISELVRQYNRMLDEIEESTRKLANSEREYAWREMAKQIAHEIKNPLTPMKLNVQQLLKSWKDNVPGFDDKLEHFAKNQIEYIDNLSSIASAFSSFAKMPSTNPSEVNLIEQIKITLELFRDAENITFDVVWPSEKKVVVFADKEHLNGIFSNLIKNGIQSIPPERPGVIGVSAEIIKNKVVVKVSDNGTGIPEELQKNLFTPNFTTKSSGMGLGLSIVRKYVETASGRIWFESNAGTGTAFFVELPLRYTVEKPISGDL